MIDLKPYMIETPFVVLTTDKLPKILNLFRHMQLKLLPVLLPPQARFDQVIAGVITR